MILVDGTDLMVPGDRFEMDWDAWDVLVHPGRPPAPRVRSKHKVVSEVLKVFIRSSCEIRYLCFSLNDPRRETFVLGQITEPVYQVSMTHPKLNVSAFVITEAAARAGVRSVSPELPTLYTQEAADLLVQQINNIQLKENFGYLIPQR